MNVSTVAGIPIRLHWSFLALVGVIGAAGLVGAGPIGLAASMVGVVALFGSVALHELGHAMTARHYGIRTAHITLYPFGGVAAIERMPADPGQELAIALAGPAVNFALVTAFGWVAAVSGGGTLAQVLEVFASMNLIMGLFNLVPAFPMDGGRVLRALLVRRMGWFRATDLSIRIGRGFAWAFLVIGVVRVPSLLLVSMFLHAALSAERRQLTRAAFSRWTDPHFGPGWSRA